MGVLPNSFVVDDVNNDGIPDVSVANLGRGSVGGSLGVRYGDGAGGLGELMTLTAPLDPPTPSMPLPRPAGIFALVQADFDGDGITDQAVGYYDCRVTFFRGTEEGSYEATTTTEFVYESRLMLTGDFDQDGDTDIAGAGAAGDGVVLVNNGDLFTNPKPERYDVPFGFNGRGNARSGVLRDVNRDGDPDIVVGTDNGLIALIGGEGASFINGGTVEEQPSLEIPDVPSAAVTAVVGGHFDGDELRDFAIACEGTSRLEIHAQGEFGYEPVLDVDVPSAAYVAAGDIDGDGLTDLAGTGSILWIALSGTVPPSMPLTTISRPSVSGVVVNEILPKNERVRLPADGFLPTDAVEIFNNTEGAIDLLGWSLSLLRTNGETDEFTVGSSVPVAAGGRAVFICRTGSSALHTGFKLPAEGG